MATSTTARTKILLLILVCTTVPALKAQSNTNRDSFTPCQRQCIDAPPKPEKSKKEKALMLVPVIGAIAAATFAGGFALTGKKRKSLFVSSPVVPTASPTPRIIQDDWRDDFNPDIPDIAPEPTPEPLTVLLFAGGLFGIGTVMRRRKRAKR